MAMTTKIQNAISAAAMLKAAEIVDEIEENLGYKGLIDLARRSGQIVSISAHEVCQEDKFELVYGLEERLNHTPAMAERGDVIGFYAVAKLKDGGNAFEFMSVHQVREIMKASQSKGNYGPWKDHFVEMGRKTVIRRLAKYLPLSVEFQTAAALDTKAELGEDQHLDSIDGEFMPAADDPSLSFVEQPAEEMSGHPQQDAPEVTYAQVADKINKSDSLDVLEIAGDLIQMVSSIDQRNELGKLYKEKLESFKEAKK